MFTTWHNKGHGRLADHAAWLVHQHWHKTGQHNTADLLARHAWNASCRHPRLAAAHARTTGRASDLPRLQAAIDICDQTLPQRADSTDDAWTDLITTRARLAGQHARRTPKPSGQVDSNGNPTPVRRHHPDVPQRNRPARFRPAPDTTRSALRDTGMS